MRVLQVEDDSNTAQTVERMLRSEGHDCDTTDLGEDAVQLAKKNDYDVILLDITLPDIDGLEVMKRLREARVQIPVLFQSGLARDIYEDSAAGNGECLVKPFGKAELTNGIAAAIATRTPAPAPDGGDGAEPTERERRGVSRSRTIKAGQIIYNNYSCIMDCVVLSLSKGGATLQPADMLNFPDHFTLRVKHGPTYDCEVRWQKGKKLGVRFSTY